MSTHDSRNWARRDFLCRMSLLSGAAFTASAAPLPLLAKPEAVVHWQGASPSAYTRMDEALGNYPGYSAAIDFGRGHLFADGPVEVDAQLMM